MKTSDIKHIQAFYLEQRQALYTYALSQVRSREWAEDVLHTVFAELLNRNQLPDGLKPYLFKSIRNRAIDVLRKRTRQHQLESMFEPPSNCPSTETRILIEETLQQVSPDERETIIMKSYTGLTFEEIAQVRSVSINTVSSWYRRGLKKMRNHIEEVPHE